MLASPQQNYQGKPFVLLHYERQISGNCVQSLVIVSNTVNDGISAIYLDF